MTKSTAYMKSAKMTVETAQRAVKNGLKLLKNSV